MDRERMRRIGALGGAARMRLYGNPGTVEGRRLGGLHSLKTHRSSSSGFKVLKKIRAPRHSRKLAELLGVFMGDGHVHVYQASICTNSETDKEHALHVKRLIENLFHMPVSLRDRSDIRACTITVSSKEFCRYLVTQGMPRGSKINLGLTIPSWVLENQEYRRAFLRGLIDTDGSVYEDKHTIKGVSYSSTCIAFTSASSELRKFVTSTLRQEDWTPTLSGRDVRLRRKKEVLAYATVIGFSNPKHSRKIRV